MSCIECSKSFLSICNVLDVALAAYPCHVVDIAMAAYPYVMHWKYQWLPIHMSCIGSSNGCLSICRILDAAMAAYPYVM